MKLIVKAIVLFCISTATYAKEFAAGIFIATQFLRGSGGTASRHQQRLQ